MNDPSARAPRFFARWRRRSPTFPWATALVGAAILIASAPPSGWREGASNFIFYWLVLLFLGFVGAVLLTTSLAYVITRDDPEEIINSVRVAQVVMILAIVGLWGWTPTWLPSDPGDRSP